MDAIAPEVGQQPITQPKPRKPAGRPKGSESARNRARVIELVHTVPGISIRELATETGLAKKSIQGMFDKYQINKQELDEFKENQADILLGLTDRIVRNITTEKLEKANAKDLAICMGIAVEKQRLVSGQSTGNIASWVKMVSKVHDNMQQTVAKDPNT